LLAQKKYKTGNGPTILLNAHLDTAEELESGRKIVKHGPIWSSSSGILGADDRAGVAVLLEVAKWLETSDFNGTIKFAFTVEEECGLIGAKELEEYFLWDKEEIEWFRSELYKCDFVNWAEEYYAPACDGTHWTVRIEYDTYCEIKWGSNHFPPKWTKFCKAVSKISGREFY
jgi:hypothetical protein